MPNLTQAEAFPILQFPSQKARNLGLHHPSLEKFLRLVQAQRCSEHDIDSERAQEALHAWLLVNYTYYDLLQSVYLVRIPLNCMQVVLGPDLKILSHCLKLSRQMHAGTRKREREFHKYEPCMCVCLMKYNYMLDCYFLVVVLVLLGNVSPWMGLLALA